MTKPKKYPVWNWVALLYPVSAFFHGLYEGVPLAISWLYALSNLGYLLAIITIYPGRFLLFGLTTRISVFIFALIAWLTGFVFTNLLL